MACRYTCNNGCRNVHIYVEILIEQYLYCSKYMLNSDLLHKHRCVVFRVVFHHKYITTANSNVKVYKHCIEVSPDISYNISSKNCMSSGCGLLQDKIVRPYQYYTLVLSPSKIP